MLVRTFLQLWIGGAALSLVALGASDPPQRTLLHGVEPAGYEVLALQPGRAVLTLLGLIECPELEGAQQIVDGTRSRIIASDGKPLRYFPSNFSFRVTATLRKTVLVDPTEVTRIQEADEDGPRNLLLKLRFSLKIHHGLEVRQVQPASIQMIGVPADVPYDERVYRVSFTLDDLPVTDRCVLEVLGPDGTRMARFPFDLL